MNKVVKIISWLFGILAFTIGIVNIFWGNDFYFGLFIVLLSFIYFLPVNSIIRGMIGIELPRMGIVKILVAFFILFASLGVGELFHKIDLMISDQSITLHR